MAPAMYFDEGLSAPFDHALTMTTTILKPTSRGSVSLRSARPDAKPRIHHNYLATEYDRATLIASVRLAMDLFAQPNLSKVRRAPFSVPTSDAEADIVAFIEQRTGTNYHPTSTCAIGRVVDSDLRVFGRVVIVEQVELDRVISRAIEEDLVKRPIVRINLFRILRAVCVLKGGCLQRGAAHARVSLFPHFGSPRTASSDRTRHRCLPGTHCRSGR
jgi:hypothetical protein